MKRVSRYLKMRVLGAIEFAPGASIVERIRHVSEQTFVDEDGARFEFTWRTIQTWYSRYKKDGTTSVVGKVRSDKGHTRKVEPEQLLEAIEPVRGSFRGPANIAAIYRACIDNNLLAARARRAQHLPPDRQSARAAQARCRHREQATPGLREGPRQPALAGRHHVWSTRAGGRGQGAVQADRLPR